MHAHRSGEFLPAELDYFPALLLRLGRVHSLFTSPHPLSKVEDETDSEVPRTNTLVSIECFHGKFLEYLVENRFYSLMYHYLDSYGWAAGAMILFTGCKFICRLGVTESSISLLGLDEIGQPWVNVLLQYRLAALNPQGKSLLKKSDELWFCPDLNTVFKASLCCGQFLLSPDFTAGKATVMGMLQNGRPLMAIATLMYALFPLKEVS